VTLGAVTGVGGRRGRGGPWPRRLSLVVVLAAVVGTALVAASGGVRGSDQYWYLADVQTLIDGGSATTNNIFPVGLLGDRSGVPPPFVHNVLSLYLAVLPATLVGAMGGWVVLNVVSTLVTAALVYGAARSVATSWAALLVAVGYATLPIVTWHTPQPLAEASTSAFAALAIYALARAGTSGRGWLVVTGTVGLLYLSRQSYLPLLLAVPVAFVVVRAWEGGARLRNACVPAIGLALTAGLITLAGGVMFASENVDFSYSRLLHTAVPGRTDNMWFNFELSKANLDNALPLDLGLVWAKLSANLGEQLLRFDSLPVAAFFWTFNALAIVAAAALAGTLRGARDPLRLRLVVAALAFVAIHLVTIGLFQNQFRYLVPALPGLLVVLAMVLSDRSWMSARLAGRKTAVAIVVTLLMLAPNLYLARTLRDDGLASAATEAAVDRLLDRTVPADQALLVEYAGTPQILGYAARPRLVLWVADHYSSADLDRLRHALPAGWLLAPVDSPLPLRAGADAPIDRVDALGRAWGLYRLP